MLSSFSSLTSLPVSANSMQLIVTSSLLEFFLLVALEAVPGEVPEVGAVQAIASVAVLVLHQS